MAWTSILTFLAVAFLLLCVPVSANDQKPSAYEALLQYNFPAGLLPKGATGYRLNKDTGEFTAYLNGSCSFALENAYQLRYKPVIKGQISDGRLQRLSGVSVKVVLVWLNIVEVRRNSNDLEFSVGFASAKFPARNFEVCPQCGCGLECGKGSIPEEIDSRYSSS